MIWVFEKVFCRIVHGIAKVAIPLLPLPSQEVLAGPGAVKRLPGSVKEKGVHKLLIVTDKGIVDAGLLEGLFVGLRENGLSYTIFNEVQPNPSIENVEDGLKLYLGDNCEGIIGFGGGSPMDCAKVIAARSANMKRPVAKMRGLFKVGIGKKLPPLFAVPTTAGTGSETTIAAVVTDASTHEKFGVADPKLMPQVAVLDPELMLGLPPNLTSTTGMDALTHAVEAYVGLMANKFTDENAEKATRIIFGTLEEVYKDGSDLEKRNDMAMASFYAGVAFTRAFVGYVHAVAHQMGGLYGVPHGLANAIILPYVLEFSEKKARKKLARLAIAAGIGKSGDSEEEASRKFIERIKVMNRNMDIPTTIKELQEKDIPLIVERVLYEAHPLYPVPRMMNKKECEDLVRRLLP
ncbi:MAG: iron-containing alcohol dehydrogenase [Desulfatiglans sp.]|jgi:alcohol dehydrogenase class IV|nr:iron-containing alcohol dehydrogenase [Thermodesulfobacteriota bacterium]MEE4351718.1 iron-containing alcohol dehydrogenase [Desulfatiglans sp.]